MFGLKQNQEEIMNILAKIEKNHRDNYHTLQGEVAGIHNEIEQLTEFLKELDLQCIDDIFNQVIDSVNYLQDVIDAISIEDKKEKAD